MEHAPPAVAGGGQERTIMHVDMDAFYASVEVREQPGLRGRPVIVGGTGNRGVVASANYEARSFGARSAMPTAHARRLCPHAVFLQPRFAVYHRYSTDLHAIFNAVTPLVEGLGLDEAFLDVSGSGALLGSPVQVAEGLRGRVEAELGLACSIGIGPNKLVAKLASKAAKPRPSKQGRAPVPGPGIVLVGAPEVTGFLWPLPVDSLWGVGPANRDRLRKLGVASVGELAALPEATLVAALGKSMGHLLSELAWGRDERPVTPERAPKSIGHEETYSADVVDREELDRRLVVMADLVATRVREHGMVARTVVLKLRYADFTTLTRSHTFPSPQRTGPAFWGAARALLASLDLREGARLLGVSATGLLAGNESPGEQLSLQFQGGPATGQGARERPGSPGLQHEQAAWDRASRAVDAVRARFGDQAVGPAAAARAVGAPRGQRDALPEL